MRPGIKRDSDREQVTKIARACERLGLQFQRVSPYSVVCVAPPKFFGADEARYMLRLGFTPTRAAWNAYCRTVKEYMPQKMADFFLGPSCYVSNFRFPDDESEFDFG